MVKKMPQMAPQLREVKLDKKSSSKNQNKSKKRLDSRKEYSEQVVQINRITRVVAGGKRLRFRAVLVIGNQKGRIGLGVSKANDVSSAVKKAIRIAKKNMIDVLIINETIPHEIVQKFGSAQVLLKPASRGTGIIAGGPIRVVANLAGIRNISGKILGSQNKMNNLKATFQALKKLKELSKNKPSQNKGEK